MAQRKAGRTVGYTTGFAPPSSSPSCSPAIRALAAEVKSDGGRRTLTPSTSTRKALIKNELGMFTTSSDSDDIRAAVNLLNSLKRNAGRTVQESKDERPQSAEAEPSTAKQVEPTVTGSTRTAPLAEQPQSQQSKLPGWRMEERVRGKSSPTRNTLSELVIVSVPQQRAEGKLQRTLERPPEGSVPTEPIIAVQTPEWSGALPTSPTGPTISPLEKRLLAPLSASPASTAISDLSEMELGPLNLSIGAAEEAKDMRLQVEHRKQKLQLQSQILERRVSTLWEGMAAEKAQGLEEAKMKLAQLHRENIAIREEWKEKADTFYDKYTQQMQQNAQLIEYCNLIQRKVAENERIAYRATCDLQLRQAEWSREALEKDKKIEALSELTDTMRAEIGKLQAEQELLLSTKRDLYEKCQIITQQLKEKHGEVEEQLRRRQVLESQWSKRVVDLEARLEEVLENVNEGGIGSSPSARSIRRVGSAQSRALRDREDSFTSHLPLVGSVSSLSRLGSPTHSDSPSPSVDGVVSRELVKERLKSRRTQQWLCQILAATEESLMECHDLDAVTLRTALTHKNPRRRRSRLHSRTSFVSEGLDFQQNKYTVDLDREHFLPDSLLLEPCRKLLDRVCRAMNLLSGDMAQRLGGYWRLVKGGISLKSALSANPHKALEESRMAFYHAMKDHLWFRHKVLSDLEGDLHASACDLFAKEKELREINRVLQLERLVEKTRGELAKQTDKYDSLGRRFADLVNQVLLVKQNLSLTVTTIAGTLSEMGLSFKGDLPYMRSNEGQGHLSTAACLEVPGPGEQACKLMTEFMKGTRGYFSHPRREDPSFRVDSPDRPLLRSSSRARSASMRRRSHTHIVAKSEPTGRRGNGWAKARNALRFLKYVRPIRSPPSKPSSRVSFQEQVPSPALPEASSSPVPLPTLSLPSQEATPAVPMVPPLSHSSTPEQPPRPPVTPLSPNSTAEGLPLSKPPFVLKLDPPEEGGQLEDFGWTIPTSRQHILGHHGIVPRVRTATAPRSGYEYKGRLREYFGRECIVLGQSSTEHQVHIKFSDGTVFHWYWVDMDVRDVPPRLLVRAPAAHQINGVYTILSDDIGCLPTWGDGPKRIFASKAGYWMVSENASGPLKQVGYLQSTLKHGKRMPHKMTSWEHYNGEEWVESPDVVVCTPLPAAGDVVAGNIEVAGPPLAEEWLTVEQAKERLLQLPAAMGFTFQTHKDGTAAVNSYGEHLVSFWTSWHLKPSTSHKACKKEWTVNGVFEKHEEQSPLSPRTRRKVALGKTHVSLAALAFMQRMTKRGATAQQGVGKGTAESSDTFIQIPIVSREDSSIFSITVSGEATPPSHSTPQSEKKNTEFNSPLLGVPSQELTSFRFGEAPSKANPSYPFQGCEPAKK